MATSNDIVRPNLSYARQGTINSPKEMISVKTDDAGRNIVKINSSSLSVLQACGRKSKYLLYDGWRNKIEGDALVFGKAIHRALEIFYTHKSKERELPANMVENAELIAHGNMPNEDHFIYDAFKAFIDIASPLKALPNTDKRSLVSGIWVLCHYFKHYLHDGYSAHCDSAGPFLERYFEFPLYTSTQTIIYLFGTIDFCLKNEKTGDLVVGDHKTTSVMGIPFLQRIKPNHQYTGYLLGARNNFKINTTDFMVNGIQVKSKPLTKRGGPPTFTRQVTKRNDHDFVEFEDAIVESVELYLKRMTSGKWPIGPVDACANYGGCQYLDVCSAPNELRETILKNTYNQVGV